MRDGGKQPALDGVRAVAILLVLGQHAPTRPFINGYVGVTVFFCLSGYLITTLLVRELQTGTIDVRAFYRRRAARLYPALVTVAAATIVVLLIGRHDLSVGQIFAPAGAAATYSTSLFDWAGHPFATQDYFNYTWTLSVEEQFYLVWPFVVAALSARGLLRFCFVVAALALGFRIGVWGLGFSPEIAYENTLARMDALSLGAAGAALLRDPAAVTRLAPKLRPALIVAALALAALAPFGMARTGAVTQIAGYSLLAIVFALLIARGVIEQATGGGRLATVLSARPLRFFGKYSYAIYVFHLPVHIFVARVLLADQLAYRGAGRYLAIQLAYAFAMTGLLLGMAMLSYHLFEKHFLKLKKYFATAAG